MSCANTLEYLMLNQEKLMQETNVTPEALGFLFLGDSSLLVSQLQDSNLKGLIANLQIEYSKNHVLIQNLVANSVIGEAIIEAFVEGAAKGDYRELSGKYPKILSSLDGQNGEFSVSSKPISKTFYNLGAGVGARSGITEFEVCYDVTLAKKFVGHTGAVKVRVNL